MKLATDIFIGLLASFLAAFLALILTPIYEFCRTWWNFRKYEGNWGSYSFNEVAFDSYDRAHAFVKITILKNFVLKINHTDKSYPEFGNVWEGNIYINKQYQTFGKMIWKYTYANLVQAEFPVMISEVYFEKTADGLIIKMLDTGGKEAKLFFKPHKNNL